MDPDRSRQDRMRPDRMGSERMGSDRMGSDRLGSDRISRDRMGPDRMSRERMSPERPSRPVRAGTPPQARGAAPPVRGAAARRDPGYPRVSEGRRPGDPRAAGRGIDRADERRADERRPPARPAESPRNRAQPVTAETGGGRIRGMVAVLGVFLVTLAGAGFDSFVGIGLGMITLICLVASTVFATLLVRRRDLLSVVVSPPLVFVAVAAVNIGLAPSAHFNLPTIATLLVRGFPTMAIATGTAIVLALFRLVARR
jgi:pentapeptide MXKDX repeat protein